VSKLELCSDRHPIEGLQQLFAARPNLAEALIDHRFSLLLPPELTRALRVLELSRSRSAASSGVAVRVLALGAAFEPEQATNQATVRPTAP
jgi:hypothetical protein